MPNSDFFSRLGLFVVRDFFDANLCSRLRAELRVAPATPAKVADNDYLSRVDSAIRRTNLLQVKSDTRALIDARMAEVRPALEAHFRVPLTGWEAVNFLRYAPGDYFHRHTDANPASESQNDSRVWWASLVLFL